MPVESLRSPSSNGADPTGGGGGVNDWAEYFSSMFAKALLIATPEKQLVDPQKRKPNGANAVLSEQIARMERELVSLQSQVKSIEDSYGLGNLHLSVAKGYLAKLLANSRIVRWLAQSRQEYLNEFQTIAEIESIRAAKAAAE
jgi:hypothetical protein